MNMKTDDIYMRASPRQASPSATSTCRSFTHLWDQRVWYAAAESAEERRFALPRSVSKGIDYWPNGAGTQDAARSTTDL